LLRPRLRPWPTPVGGAISTTAGADLDLDKRSLWFAAGNIPGAGTGVDPGDWVSIILNLEPGKTYHDVLIAIAQGFTNPQPGQNTSLRIGIHVQGFAGRGSESFILVPEGSAPTRASLAAVGRDPAGTGARRRGPVGCPLDRPTPPFPRAAAPARLGARLRFGRPPSPVPAGRQTKLLLPLRTTTANSRP
jgi:hypothetical protein